MSCSTFTNNLGRITDFGLSFRPDQPALFQDDLHLTYRELENRTNRVANGVLAAGIPRGGRVLILWENDIRFVEVTLGVIRAGAVAVPINPRLPVDKHRLHLTDSGATMVLASRSTQPSATAFVADGSVDFAVGLDGGRHGLVDYETWLAGNPADRPNIEVHPDDLAWLPYTSGSTGTPKGVRISHRMLLRDAELVVHTCYLGTDDRALISTPLFHMNAAAVGVLPCLYAGASAYILPAFDPTEVLRGVEEQRCTYTTGVPAMYKLLLTDTEGLARRDLSSLRMIACGSAPMPLALIEQLSAVFPNAVFTEGYGLTECGPVATLVPPYGMRKVGSIGLPLPGFEVRIVDDHGNDLPSGETGELWMRSECTNLGYHNRPEEDARRRKPHGWFATGDLVVRDAEGWLFFRGRADDMMSVGGENVYPAEIEAILSRHPAVRDTAVVPTPHDTKGEVPVAFVVREPGSEVTEQALREFFLGAGPAYAHPRTITFLDAMPLSATGKTDRTQLTALAVSSGQTTVPA